MPGASQWALAHALAEAGHEASRVETNARVHPEPTDSGPTITRIELQTEGEVPGLDADEFQRQAEAAEAGCAVSRALAGVDISLDAKLADA